MRSHSAVADAAVAVPPRRHRRRPGYFFVGMAAAAAAILGYTFIPEYRGFAAGTFPIATVVNVHAAIMAAWVAAFAVQAYLGATGRIDLHRRIGRCAVATGWIAWTSMVFVEIRAIIAHPVPRNSVDYDWLLPGPYTYLTFGILLAWAVSERQRPAWHKRLMTFAVFVTLQAAIQRFLWLPVTYGYWPFALAIDVTLLVPMIGYDLTILKGRLHPATIRGTLLLTGAQAALLALWGSPVWRSFAFTVVHALHR